MSRKCIVVDLDRCFGCFGCELACKTENAIALGEHWNKVQIQGPFGTFPNVEQYWLPTMCQQCADAPCVAVCPTGASYRREEDGLVLVDADACIGCQICLDACPYHVRSFNTERRIVQKCTLCSHLTDEGEKPACVKACCAEARFFGDLDDPASDASVALAAADPASVHRLADSGNGPTAAYILSEKTAAWQEWPQA